jgi:glycerol-3-phosphate dehydrogenase (NAD(P)+)
MGVVIIGTGNWGSTLAGLVNPRQPLRMWCESPEWIARTKDRLKSVAGADRPGITVELAFSTPLSADDVVVMVIPSSQVEPVARRLEQNGPPYPILVTASKGLERETFRTMSQVIKAVLPDATVAVISGPNIAKEIAEGRPAKAVVGCENVTALIKVAQALRSERFRLDMTRDTVDLELCAAMKGVFAIGAGIIAQRKMGSNFMGLMMTFGLREIAEVGKFLGISSSHIFGITGLGDLVATCFSPDSRNFRLGEFLASGVPLAEALDRVGMVVEGAMTASAVSEMAVLRLPVPLFSAIAAIVEKPGEDSIAGFERVLLEYPGC